MWRRDPPRLPDYLHNGDCSFPPPLRRTLPAYPPPLISRPLYSSPTDPPSGTPSSRAVRPLPGAASGGIPGRGVLGKAGLGKTPGALPGANKGNRQPTGWGAERAEQPQLPRLRAQRVSKTAAGRWRDPSPQGGVERRGAGGQRSGGARGEPRAQGIDVQHSSALFTARTRRLLLGCLWINQGRGGIPGFPPAPRDCGPTTNPRARGPKEPRFLHCTGNMEGRRKVQVPLDLACRMYRRRNPGSLQGWGRRYHNKRTCVLPRVRGAPPVLRSRPAEPGLCLSYREGTALGAPLAGGGRLTHLKGTAWVSDQTTKFKNIRKHEGRK